MIEHDDDTLPDPADQAPDAFDATAVTPLRWLTDCYYQTQKLRIQVGNRLAAIQRQADAGPPPASAVLMYDRLGDVEAALVHDMADTLRGHPAMTWLGQVKGVGPTLAAKLLGLIGEIDSFTTVSKLWRFAGLAVAPCVLPRGHDGDHQYLIGWPGALDATTEPCGAGQRERPVKGERLHYNMRLKTTCYLIAGSFLKCDSPYRAIYDRARVQYADTRPQWTKAHQHLAALRKMEKVFLTHLWLTWRTAAGLPVRPPYGSERLGHHDDDPWTYATKPVKAGRAG